METLQKLAGSPPISPPPPVTDLQKRPTIFWQCIHSTQPRSRLEEYAESHMAEKLSFHSLEFCPLSELTDTGQITRRFITHRSDIRCPLVSDLKLSPTVWAYGAYPSQSAIHQTSPDPLLCHPGVLRNSPSACRILSAGTVMITRKQIIDSRNAAYASPTHLELTFQRVRCCSCGDTR